MVALHVLFKSNTSVDWATEKLLDLGLEAGQIDKSQFSYFNPVIKIYVEVRNKLRFYRAIHMISSQVVSITGA